MFEFDTPEWANWVAVENTGKAYAYDNKPRWSTVYNTWVRSGGFNDRVMFAGRSHAYLCLFKRVDSPKVEEPKPAVEDYFSKKWGNHK